MADDMRALWIAQSVRELRKLCKESSLTCRGTKDEVIDRLMQHFELTTGVPKPTAALREDGAMPEPAVPRETVKQQAAQASASQETQVQGLARKEIQGLVLPSEKRARVVPARYIPATKREELEDDSDSDWAGIVLDGEDSESEDGEDGESKSGDLSLSPTGSSSERSRAPPRHS